MMNLVDFIHKHASSMPNDIAVYSPNLNLTWENLDRFIWSTSYHFLNLGIKEHDCIALQFSDPIKHLITALALTKLGAIQLTLPSTSNPKIFSDLKIEYGASKIIYDLTPPPDKSLELIHFCNFVDIDLDPQEKQKIHSANIQSPWSFLKTSGTTGAPKKLVITQKDVLDRNDRADFLTYDKFDVVWAISGLNFISSKRRIFEALTAGVSIFLPLPGPIAKSLIDYISSNAINIFFGTPSHLRQITDHGVQLPNLKAFEVGSSIVDEKLRTDFKTSISPNLFVIYATNEAGIISVAPPDLVSNFNNSVGFPLSKINVEIVNDDDNQVSFDTPGQIRVKGPGVLSSYLDNPVANSKFFKNGWFYTGDIGFISIDGELILKGRVDDMMIYDGINIFPAEIENALLNFPGVTEVAAFPIHHKRFKDIPAVAIVGSPSINKEEIINYSKFHLGMIYPRYFFMVSELPRNDAGKILRSRLSEAFNRKINSM